MRKTAYRKIKGVRPELSIWATLVYQDPVASLDKIIDNTDMQVDLRQLKVALSPLIQARITQPSLGYARRALVEY